MSSSTLNTLSIWFLFITLSFSFVIQTTTAADPHHVYILFTDEPKGQDFKQYSIQILTPVIGSTKEAEGALLEAYVAVGGFAASLTPEQAAKVKNQPGVKAVLLDEAIGLQPNNS